MPNALHLVLAILLCAAAPHLFAQLDTSFYPAIFGDVRNKQIIMSPAGPLVYQGGENLRFVRLTDSGGIDPTFNAPDNYQPILVQPDGKIIARKYVPFGEGFSVVRLHPNGSLDITFAGTNETNGHPNDLRVDGIYLPDGRVLVVNGYRIVMLNQDGTSSTFYNANDYFKGVFGGVITCVERQADGKILVGMQGRKLFEEDTSYRLVRLMGDGSRETSFEVYPDNSVEDIICQPDQKILIAGQFSNILFNPRTGLARLDTEGRVDPSFNPVFSWTETELFVRYLPTGDEQSRSYTASPYILRMALQADGKLVVFGSFDKLFFQSCASIARLHTQSNEYVTSGTYDGSFLAGVEYPAGARLLRGHKEYTPYTDHVKKTWPDGVEWEWFDAGLAMDKEGKVLVGGQFETANWNPRRVLARFHRGTTYGNLVPANSVISCKRGGDSPNSAIIEWTRTGAVPEFSAVTFDQSSDGGSTWTPLGAGSRVSAVSEAPWRLEGVNVSVAGQIRAMGQVNRGGLIEEKLAYDLSVAPVVSAPTATGITTNGAVLGGTVTPDPATPVTGRGIVYCFSTVNGEPEIGGVGVREVPANDSNPFTVTLTSLANPSSYSYRAYATYSGGVVYSQVATFSTADTAAATVISPTATGLSGVNATLGGNVASGGTSPITERGVCFALTSVTADPRPNDGTATKVTTPGTTGVFTVNVSGLVGGAQYSFRAYAVSAEGWAWSQVGTFTMPASPPEIDGLPLSGLASTSVYLNGNVRNSNGAPVTDRGALVAPATYTGPMQVGVPGVRQFSAGPGTGNFAAWAYALQPSTLYRAAVYATNSSGTSYDDLVYFETPSDNSLLSDLKVTGGTLNLSFSSFQSTYYCFVPLTAPSFQVQPFKAHAKATIRLNGDVLASGATSPPLTTDAVIEVTAEDGSVRPYRLYIERAGLTWNYTSAADVPLSTDDFTASSQISLSLGFDPPTGTSLMLVNNTGNLPNKRGNWLYHGAGVTMMRKGLMYQFVANFYGGDGNDVVLQWAKMQVRSFGFNESGQLGNNTTTNRQYIAGEVEQNWPLKSGLLMAVAAGGSHSMALKADGTVATWGSNQWGQAGTGEGTATYLVPVDVSMGLLAGRRGVAIAAGAGHSLMLCEDGTVLAWGDNRGGQLGDGTTTQRSTPVLVDTSPGSALAGKTVVAIAAAGTHSVALCSDGKVVIWGTCDGLSSSLRPVVYQHSDTPTHQIWTGPGRVFALSRGLEARAAGANSYGQLGIGDLSASTGTVLFYGGLGPSCSFAVGGEHTLLLTKLAAGTSLSGFGFGNDGRIGPLGSGSYPRKIFDGALAGKTVLAAAASSSLSLALCTDNTLAQFGPSPGVGPIMTPAALDVVEWVRGERLVSINSSGDGRHFLFLAALPVTMPTVTTQAAGPISATSATLNGRINPNYHSPVVTFEYGTTTSYGTSIVVTPETLPIVDTDVQVTAVPTGLQPGTTYHYRVVAGDIVGADMTFTTRTLANSTPAGSIDATFNTMVAGDSFCVVPLAGSNMLVAKGYAVMRVNADGSADSGFAVALQSGAVRCMAQQPDGKILLGGFFMGVNGVSRSYIARVDSTGKLDSTTDFAPPSAISNVYSLLVLPDGKIMVGGEFDTGIMRLNADGSKDTSFTPIANGAVYCMLLQPDGKILIGGNFYQILGGDGTGYRNGIARLNADGTVESINTFKIGTGTGGVRSMALQADGKIVLGGDFSVFNGQPRSRIARLNADGTLESAATFNASFSGTVYALTLQADGRLVAGGDFTSCNGVPISYFARIQSNGSLDSAADFERGTGGDSWVLGLGLRTDGKIAVSGSFFVFNDARRQGLAVLNNDAAISNLAVPDTSRILWTRGGSVAELERVAFELSTDDGGTWSPLGDGTRVGTTSNWQLSGLTLPTTGRIRARGRVGGSIQDTVIPYTAQPYVALATLGAPQHSSVSAYSATLGATVTGNGGATITDQGVVYCPTSVSSMPAIDGAGVIMLTVPTGGTITTSTQLLTPGVSYSYRAYAINSAGTSYSAVGAFTTLSNDASLSLISLMDLADAQGASQGAASASLSPAFQSSITSYTATVPGWVETLKMGVMMSQAGATVKVNGASLAGVNTASATTSPALMLNVGLNTLTAQATAEDGIVKTYTITVTRTGPPVLASPASRGIGTTSAALGASITGAGSSTITEMGVVLALTSTNDSPRLNGAGVIKLTSSIIGSGVFEVTAGGLTPGVGYSFACFATNAEGTTYTNALTFATVSNSATLSGLSLTGGVLSPAFDSSTTSYQTTVPNGTASVKVTSMAHAAATVVVSGSPVASGVASPPLSLQVGSNNVTVRVVAQDGVTTRLYTITITRQSVAENALQNWAAEKGLPPSASAPTADADGDGVPNLLEFAFGTSPTASSGASVKLSGTFAGGMTMTRPGQPMVAHEPTSGGPDIRAVFVRRVDHQQLGLTYTVRFSADLATWQTSTVTPTVLSTDGVHEAVSVPYPPLIDGKPPHFFTIGVSATP